MPGWSLPLWPASYFPPPARVKREYLSRLGWGRRPGFVGDYSLLGYCSYFKSPLQVECFLCGGVFFSSPSVPPLLLALAALAAVGPALPPAFSCLMLWRARRRLSTRRSCRLSFRFWSRHLLGTTILSVAVDFGITSLRGHRGLCSMMMSDLRIANLYFFAASGRGPGRGAGGGIRGGEQTGRGGGYGCRVMIIAS